MTKIVYPALAAFFLILAGCSDNSKPSGLYFKNDLEAIAGWHDEPSVIKGDAHSGNFYAVTDTAHAYSITFKRAVKEISDKPLKKVSMSIWAKCDSPNVKALYIISIETNDKPIFWEGVKIGEKFAKTGEWYKSEGTFEIPSTIHPYDIVKVYVWNQGQSPLMLDDFEFSFEN